MEFLRSLGSKINVDGGIETEVKSNFNDVGKVLRGMKKVFCCRVMWMNVTRRYEGVTVPTVLYQAETWSMAVAEKRLNIIEMRCLRSMSQVMSMD